MIDTFLAAGMDVNARRADEACTGLLLASLARDWRTVDQLLRGGADPNLADAKGVSPLMAAALADQTSAIRSLLEHGARLNTVDAAGHGALHYAVAARSIGALQGLLDAGAPCNSSRCCDGESDLVTHAIRTGDWRIIEPILTREPATLKWTRWTQGALGAAVAAREAAHTRLLLSRHPAPPPAEGRAQPLLAYSLLSGDLSQFKFLLDCGADSNTPLNSPVEKGFCQYVSSSSLKDYLSSESGMTTLMLAANLRQA